MSNIQISPKYGVNPSMIKCFMCGESYAIALLGRINDKTHHADIKAPREMFDGSICDKCKKVMEDGVIFIEVRDGESGDTPYRTGRIIGLKEEVVRKIFKGPNEALFRKRMGYMEQTLFTQLFNDTFSGKKADIPVLSD